MISTLALHGFTGSPRSWDFLPADEISKCVAPALVGHVGAAFAGDVTHFDAEIDRLAALLPDTGAAHVVGYSLGARLALGLALRHPGRVSRLTLLSAHPGLDSPSEREARRASDGAWCELLLTRGLEAFVDAWQAQPLWASQASVPAALLRKKRAERLSQTAVGLVQSLRSTGLGQMPPYLEQLTRLRIPVALLAGELDGKFCELARSMTARLPLAELEIVPGAGHDLLLERPDLITEVIRRGNQT